MEVWRSRGRLGYTESNMPRETFYRRHGRLILVVAVALAPLIGWGVYRAIASNSNDVRDWLPAQYVETRQFNWFTTHFGIQDFIVASWPGCTLDDQRLDDFARVLGDLSQRNERFRPFSRILTGRSLLAQLEAEPLEMDRELAVERLRGSILGPDGRQTCAVMTLREEAAEALEPAMEMIAQAAQAAGVPREELRLGGIPVINAAINRESTNSLVRLAGLSGLLGVLIAWLCFRDLRLTTIILVVGIYAAAASLAAVPLFGVPLNAILITMVPLVYVTALSGNIHLSNYYLEAARHVSPTEAPGKAVAHAFLPLVLAAVTTILGLLSLGYSDLNPIILFGVFSAIGVAIGSLAQFVLLPAALAVWTPLPRRFRHHSATPSDDDSHLMLWPRLGQWVTSHPGLVAVACFGLMLVTAAGLPQIRTSIQMMRLFSADAPVIPMTRWLEENLGATVPLEIILRFTPESRTTMLDRIRLVAEVDARLRQLPQATGSLSAATFAPQELSPSAVEGTVRQTTVNVMLKRRYGLLHKHGWIARDGDQEMWRISLRVRGIDDLDYAALVQELRAHVDPVLDARLGPQRPGAELVITGTAPIVFQARRSLLDGMLFGLGTDMLLIVVGILLTTRSWMTAAVMFVLSVFPTTLIFGAMGLLGIVVDVGSVMTPCVAVGVTVDDIIHFLLCYRRGVQQGMTGPQATLLAYRTCGRAMVQSWGIIGVGLSAFVLSSFTPTFRFGMLMLLLLTAGLVGNLLFLPALLAGPVGRRIAKAPMPLASLVHVETDRETT